MNDRESDSRAVPKPFPSILLNSADLAVDSHTHTHFAHISQAYNKRKNRTNPPTIHNLKKWTCLTPSSYRISSKISGFSRSRCFMRSFMAVMIELALSSAPCFELFSAAPVRVVCSKNVVCFCGGGGWRQRVLVCATNAHGSRQT